MEVGTLLRDVAAAHLVIGPPAARRRRFGEASLVPRRLPEHLLARRSHGDRLGLPQLVDLTCELANLLRRDEAEVLLGGL